MLEQNDFEVIRDDAWSDERKLNILVFELEQGWLPLVKKHLGPPIRKKAECQNFLRKHATSTKTLSGPYIENDRWVVEIKRGHKDVVSFLTERLKDGGRQIGIPKIVSRIISKDFKILLNESIAALYSAQPQFAKFVSNYFKAKPRWLEQAYTNKHNLPEGIHFSNLKEL